MKRIKVNCKDHDEFIHIYLSLFKGALGITDSELKVLAELVKNYIQLISKVEEPYLSELLFSSERKKKMSTDADMSLNSFHNHLSNLKTKNIISNMSKFDQRLIPDLEISFSFLINDEKSISKEDNSIKNVKNTVKTKKKSKMKKEKKQTVPKEEVYVDNPYKYSEEGKRVNDSSTKVITKIEPNESEGLFDSEVVVEDYDKEK